MSTRNSSRNSSSKSRRSSSKRDCSTSALHQSSTKKLSSRRGSSSTKTTTTMTSASRGKRAGQVCFSMATLRRMLQMAMLVDPELFPRIEFDAMGKPITTPELARACRASRFGGADEAGNTCVAFTKQDKHDNSTIDGLMATLQDMVDAESKLKGIKVQIPPRHWFDSATFGDSHRLIEEWSDNASVLEVETLLPYRCIKDGNMAKECFESFVERFNHNAKMKYIGFAVDLNAAAAAEKVGDLLEFAWNQSIKSKAHTFLPAADTVHDINTEPMKRNFTYPVVNKQPRYNYISFTFLNGDSVVKASTIRTDTASVASASSTSASSMISAAAAGGGLQAVLAARAASQTQSAYSPVMQMIAANRGTTPATNDVINASGRWSATIFIDRTANTIEVFHPHGMNLVGKDFTALKAIKTRMSNMLSPSAMAKWEVDTNHMPTHLDPQEHDDGMYHLWYLTERLSGGKKGRSALNKRMPAAQMDKLKNVYFRPLFSEEFPNNVGAPALPMDKAATAAAAMAAIAAANTQDALNPNYKPGDFIDTAYPPFNKTW